jgi:hypothetical protein
VLAGVGDEEEDDEVDDRSTDKSQAKHPPQYAGDTAIQENQNTIENKRFF